MALNPKDAKFANLRESFDQKNAVTFIEQLRSVSAATPFVDDKLQFMLKYTAYLEASHYNCLCRALKGCRLFRVASRKLLVQLHGMEKKGSSRRKMNSR